MVFYNEAEETKQLFGTNKTWDGLTTKKLWTSYKSVRCLGIWWRYTLVWRIFSKKTLAELFWPQERRGHTMSSATAGEFLQIEAMFVNRKDQTKLFSSAVFVNQSRNWVLNIFFSELFPATLVHGVCGHFCVCDLDPFQWRIQDKTKLKESWKESPIFKHSACSHPISFSSPQRLFREPSTMNRAQSQAECRR